MSAQGGLIPKGAINNDKIITPEGTGLVQLHRDDALPGAGMYYGKLPDGTEEPISGGVGSSGVELWHFHIWNPGQITSDDIMFATPNSDTQAGIFSNMYILAQKNYQYKGDKVLTAKNLTLRVETQDIGASITIEILKNGVATGLLVVVPDAVQDVIVSDLVNSFTFTTDDNIVLRGTTDGGEQGGGITTFYCTMEVEG